VSPYAQGTEVPADRSRAEIEKMLARFGADQFISGWEKDRVAMIGFRVHGRMVRIALPMPDPSDPLIRLTPAGRVRKPLQQKDAYAKEERRRWRSLVLVIKAKLAAVEDGISTIEREFLADVLLPDGTTLASWVAPQIERAYATAEMPTMLPALGVGGEGAHDD
jgi:hypothetical protein